MCTNLYNYIFIKKSIAASSLDCPKSIRKSVELLYDLMLVSYDTETNSFIDFVKKFWIFLDQNARQNALIEF